MRLGILVTIISTLLLDINHFSEAKHFLRCELAKELYQRHSFSKTFLPHWICMIEHESGRDTQKIIKKPNGTSSYGLFQINSKRWCLSGQPGGLCKQKCEDFTDDKLEDDVKCANLIFNTEGFKHWNGWIQSCRNNKNIPNLEVICKIMK